MVVFVGEECLRLCDKLIRGTKINDNDSDKVHPMACLCLVYFLTKIQRVTRSALTLILAGQGVEAMSLIREQNNFVMALNYYRRHLDQAQLFMVSQAILKRNFADEIMNFDDEAAADPERLSQLAELKNQVVEAYRLFPAIRKIKGKSGKSKSPAYADWSEPSAYDMFFDVMNSLVREQYAERGEAIVEKTFKVRLKKIVDKVYFLGNKFISQAKHGTAFDVGAVVDFDNDGNIIPSNHQFDDSNRLAYHFIQSAMPSLIVFRDYVVPGEFEMELNALGNSYVALRTELGITDEPVKV